MPDLFDVTGVDHLGQAQRRSMQEDSAANLARSLYLVGWRTAEITVDGRLVGQVTRNLHCERTWWGDKPGVKPKPPKPVRRRARAFHTGEVRS